MANHFTGSERVAMVFISTIPVIAMIPLSVFILYMYVKYNKKKKHGLPKFKTTVTFIVVTILFYVNYTFRGINLCYGDFKYDSLYILMSTPLYGGHFFFFVILLFCRLDQVFNDTKYGLNKKTKIFFYFLVLFGLLTAVSFMLFVGTQISWWSYYSYIVGTTAVLMSYIWLSLLYVIKLFKTVRDFTQASSQSGATSSNANRRILSSITKYTLLNTISVVTNILFWSVPFMNAQTDHHFIQKCLYLMCWQLSITVNILAFVLGFHFSSKLYWKLCGKVDSYCKICFENMVYCVIQRSKPTTDEKNIELEIQQQKNQNQEPKEIDAK
eukprot:426624_1